MPSKLAHENAFDHMWPLSRLSVWSIQLGRPPPAQLCWVLGNALIQFLHVVQPRIVELHYVRRVASIQIVDHSTRPSFMQRIAHPTRRSLHASIVNGTPGAHACIVLYLRRPVWKSRWSASVLSSRVEKNQSCDRNTYEVKPPSLKCFGIHSFMVQRARVSSTSGVPYGSVDSHLQFARVRIFRERLKPMWKTSRIDHNLSCCFIALSAWSCPAVVDPARHCRIQRKSHFAL